VRGGPGGRGIRWAEGGEAYCASAESRWKLRVSIRGSCMRCGQVRSFDTPAAALQLPCGMFRGLMEEATRIKRGRGGAVWLSFLCCSFLCVLCAGNEAPGPGPMVPSPACHRTMNISTTLRYDRLTISWPPSHQDEY
jgi:hypothetical protein